jgi:TonB family protein
LTRRYLIVAVLALACTPRPGVPAGPDVPLALGATACPVLREAALARGTSVPPLPLRLPLVAYPSDLGPRVGDSARVRLVVDRDGAVPACTVTVEALSDSALLPFVAPGAASLRFRPAQAGGASAPAWLTVTLRFVPATDLTRSAGARVEVVVEQPALLEPGGPIPVYPAELIQQRTSGRVVIRAVVTPAGRIDPTSVRFVSSDHPLFTAAVRDVLPRLHFRPGRMGAEGPAIASYIQLPFDFTAP